MGGLRFEGRFRVYVINGPVRECLRSFAGACSEWRVPLRDFLVRALACFKYVAAFFPRWFGCRLQCVGCEMSGSGRPYVHLSSGFRA